MKTDAEVFGGSGLLNDADVFGSQSMEDTLGTKVKHVAQDVRTRFGDVLQLPAAVGDMILGAPANLVGRVKGAGAAVNEWMQGGSRGDMEAADMQARNLGMLESFKTPFQSAVKSLTGAEHYDQEIVAEALDKGAKAVAAKTGGVLTAHGVEMLLGTTLDALGIKGISPTVRAARARAIESQAKRELAKRPPPEGQMSDADVFTEPVSELGGEKLQKQFVREINKGIEELTPSVREIFKQAKSPAAAVDNLFAQAAREGKARFEAKGAPRPDTIGKDIGGTEKTRLNEARVLGAEEAPGISPTLDSALRKVSAGQKWDLTAEERIALQDVAQTAGLVDAQGKPLRSKQGGFSDAKLAAAIAATGLLTSGAIIYTRKNHPEVWEELKARVKRWFGGDAPLPSEERQNIEDWRKLNEERVPLRNEEGNGLAFNTEDILGPLGVGMAVKGKGGMWHPEAVGRLAEPLAKSMFQARGAVRVEQMPAVDAHNKNMNAQSDRMIRSYLNKHAGTEGDPLKDVEIPFGEGTKKWGDLWDQSISKHLPDELKNVYGGLENVSGAKPTESIHMFGNAGLTAKLQADGYKLKGNARDGWFINDPQGLTVLDGIEARNAAEAWENIATAPNGAPEFLANSASAIESYLSHAGDFARANIPPEKLGQYDLPRLIKETAANDARVAKEMEKAASDSTKSLPVYKEYPDGFKWVELKLPERLTEEQRKSVRKATTKDRVLSERFELEHDMGEAEAPYVALDSNGKIIKNNYTEETAVGRTPEEAYLAGQLAIEGNTCGHCVGGYVDSVASGESKIYSLRDPKGKSHVTVEVSPENRVNSAREAPPEDFEGTLQDWMDASGKATQADIIQIKGKQNRAPVAEYQPYVQDFVRSGKWGEVGDLENTGLRDISGFKQLQENVKGIPEGDALFQKRYLTEEEFNKLASGEISKQRGSIDPKLLAGIAVAGSAAAYLAENPQDAEALAAAGLLAGTRKGIGQVGKGLEYTLGLVSTQLGHISPALKLRARDYERVVMERTDKALDRVSPFLHAVREVKGEAGKELKIAMLTGDAAQIAEAIKGKPKLVRGWREVQNLLREFEKEHISLGRFKEGLTNYFPRIITDFEGLKKALGQQERTKLEETLARAEAKMAIDQQRGLTDIEQSLIVNRSLTSDPAFSQLPDYAKARKIREVTEKLEPFYAPPTDSLLRYISAAVQDIEMAKFFGRNLVTKKQGDKVYTDVDKSIGGVVNDLVKKKEITQKQVNPLRAILKSRFEGGEQAMSGPLQDVRNLTNAGLLGNVLSAATQIGDSMMTIYHHGLLPTLRAVKDKLTGNAEVTTKQFGLVNHIAEELGSARATGKVLQTLFKYSGFTGIDQFAKGLNLNAALTKNRSAANSVKGLEKLQEKYGRAFGDEFPALIDDLKAGRMTERVKSLLFSELSDAQPITKMEMPQAYLDNPNGRILYQMKTYMLKQMDVIRRDAYDNIANGKYVEGAKNLLAVAAALSLSNVPGDIIKNWIKGRPIDLDKIDYVENLLRTFGLNRYTTDKMTSSTPARGAVEFGINTVKPPILSMAQDLDDPKKLSKYVPIIGRTIYDRELGGNEAAFAAEQRRERLQQRALRESENPSLRDARRAREEARRRRKMEKIRRQLP